MYATTTTTNNNELNLSQKVRKLVFDEIFLYCNNASWQQI